MSSVFDDIRTFNIDRSLQIFPRSTLKPLVVTRVGTLVPLWLLTRADLVSVSLATSIVAVLASLAPFRATSPSCLAAPL
ncbi:hypothetical protein AYI69_g8797, partial [Smittium culicis]